MEGERNWKVLSTAADVSDEIAQHVVDTVDWFEGAPTMGTTEFIDRLCETYGGAGYGPDDFDLESYDSPAARKIMKIARAERRERAT